ncbi:helix-turn-helix domain-containing protein [Lactobacillus sp. ESL0791]|uniref:BglG family transcription antiterminator n=1 Tax=Lactobacillus sp. ESL0791 TaxID=2983234 RepID=UPI0023F991C5|nr:helix-turn-helix domain-containing protein [Lactobacillus sp. ESL0791]MDF7639387.1 helix-turn-helix domain-containing protein [Lactobacillus sp. ESL0791]
MSILSQRQQIILTSLVQNKTGLDANEFASLLKVSKRTFYREIENLQALLEKKDLKIVKKKRVYSLQGKPASITALAANLAAQNAPTFLSVSQRQTALIISLLLSNEPQKILNLALDLRVSESTISNDLNLVEQFLTGSSVKLEKKKGVGIYLQAAENLRRNLLVSLLASEINDYDFFRYLNDQFEEGNDFFLALLPLELLQKIKLVLDQTVFAKIKIKNDQEMVRIILTFTITVMRIKKGCSLEKNDALTLTPQFHKMVADFAAELAKKTKITLAEPDIIYLAESLAGIVKQRVTLHYDNDDELKLSFQVKNFVGRVSQKTGYDFQANPSFVNKLTSHILSLLENNVVPLPNVKIQTLDSLRKRFQKLYLTVKEAWEQEFPWYKISSSEMELLLLYFANEYENKYDVNKFSVLIVCENGIGVSSILRSRIRQEVPEIKNITLSKISDLPLLNLSKYDLLLSTIELKNFTANYQLVSPLLPAEQVNKIKDYLADYSPKSNKKCGLLPTTSGGATEQLSQATIDTLFCNELVNGIKVETITADFSTTMELIRLCLAKTEDSVIRDKRIVAQKIDERIKAAPVGIPGSNLALFHTSNREIKRCQFCVFDLQKQLRLEAMDHNFINVSRVLLMLGPENLSSAEQDVMSLVSSMIIMNDFNLALFSHGTEQQLKDAVAKECLVEILQKFRDK